MSFLDVENWKRKRHFDLFRNHAQPFFSVTVEVDAGPLWESCRASGRSFFLAAMYATLRAVNEIEAFRIRLRGERVWVHERVSIGTTIMRADETFGFARFDLVADFDAFEKAGLAEIERARAIDRFDNSPGEDDLIYHSTLPWLRFTSFTNALSLRDSIPRLTFGKVVEGRMPVAVEVHHALVDGLDVARFLERMEQGIRG